MMEITRQALWAKSSIGDRPSANFNALQEGLTVDLIATSRDLFETCSTVETLPSVIARNRSNSFDFLPVLDPTSNRIVGLLELARFIRVVESDTQIATIMRPLSEENLLGADASILAFVRNADERRCRLIVSQNEISGLVGISDPQRLPVRAALFGLVTYFEIVMTSNSTEIRTRGGLAKCLAREKTRYIERGNRKGRGK